LQNVENAAPSERTMPLLVCRVCGSDQVLGVWTNATKRVVLRCPECGAFNELPE
jgi:uncharacterized Zn finger protein